MINYILETLDASGEEEVKNEGKESPPPGYNKSVFDRPRIAPKVRRPVPVNERDKYDYSSDSRTVAKEAEVEKKKVEDVGAGKKQVIRYSQP